jgi:hypothetical protein
MKLLNPLNLTVNIMITINAEIVKIKDVASAQIFALNVEKKAIGREHAIKDTLLAKKMSALIKNIDAQKIIEDVEVAFSRKAVKIA